MVLINHNFNEIPTNSSFTHKHQLCVVWMGPTLNEACYRER